MAKVIKARGDTTKIEGAGKQAPVGLYRAKVDEVSARKSKNNEDMVEVIFKITHDANGRKIKEDYARLYFYAPLDSDASWARRLKDLVTAFGLKTKDPNVGLIDGKSALIRLREDTDQDGEYRPNISKVLKLDDAPEPDEDEPDEDEEEEEEETEENGALDEMDRAELKAYIKENGLEVKVLRSMSDDDIRGAIGEAQGEEEEEEEEEPEEEDNYDSMALKDLKQELEDRELETTGRKPVLIARLRTDDQEEPV